MEAHMKARSSRDCFICGRHQYLSTNPDNNLDDEKCDQRKWLRKWKTECVKALAESWFPDNSENLLALSCFEKGDYCSSCLQTIRDVNFTIRHLKSLQLQLDLLLKTIRDNFDLNYANLEEKSKKDEVLSRFSLLKSDANLINNYSQHELTEVIYTCMLLSRQPENYTSSITSLCQKEDSPQCSKISNFDALKEEVLEFYHDDDDSIKAEPIEVEIEEGRDGGSFFDNSDSNSDSSDDSVNYQPKVSVTKKKSAPPKDISSNEQVTENPSKICANDINKKKEGNSEVIAIGGQKNSEESFLCRYCNVIFRQHSDLTKHLSDSYQGKNPNCSAFRPEEIPSFAPIQPTKKIVIHNSYKCSVCGKEFREKSKCNRHQKIHQKSYSCEICKMTFTDWAEFCEHKRKLKHSKPKIRSKKKSKPAWMNSLPTDVTDNKCPTCNEVFSNRGHLKNHFRLHINPALTFTCTVCYKRFSSELRLQTHSEFHTMKVCCEICGKKFRFESNYRSHFKCHMEDRPFQCTVCNKRFKIKQSLNHHKVIHARSLGRFGKLQYAFNFHCKFCGKGYKNEEEIDSHYSTAHQGPNPFSCAFCTEVFSNSFHLSRHTKQEHLDEDKRKYKCHICPRVLANPKSLREHLKLHQDPSLLPKCPHCPKRCPTNDVLKRHIETHNTEIKFICETCGKGFTHSKQHQTHLKRHNTEKPFKCSICERGFTTPGGCRLHEVTHTDVKEFVCKPCGKAFNRLCNLQQHEKLHTRTDNAPIRIRKPKNATTFQE